MMESSINSYVKKNNINKSPKKSSSNTTIVSNEKKHIKDKDIEDTINSAFVKYMTEQLSETSRLHSEYKRDMNNLLPVLNEYLNNFILIGHDIIGNEVFISYSKNQNDKNAINKLFMDTFFRMAAPRNDNI